MKGPLVFFVPTLASQLILKRESEAVYGWTEDAKPDRVNTSRWSQAAGTYAQPGSALFRRAQHAPRHERGPAGSERSATAQGGEGAARPGHPHLKAGPPLPHRDLRPAQPPL